jgi:hypothetical protein
LAERGAKDDRSLPLDLESCAIVTWQSLFGKARPIERPAVVVLCASAVLGLALRVWFALHDDGIHWPDEIYQSLEPAHRLAFGYGLLAWEFLEGARSWAFPALIAIVLKCSSAMGLSSPRLYLSAIRILFCLGGVATAWAIYRLALTCGAGRLAAACGSAMFALMGLAIYFAPRAMSETACALPATLGLALCLRRRAEPSEGVYPQSAGGARRWEIGLGASLLGLSVLLRLQCALFCLGVLIVLLIRGARRTALEAAAVFALWAVLFGLLDKLTWGSWFHSALAYLRFNLVQGRAQDFGTAPPAYYTAALFSALGPLWILIAALALVAITAAPGLWLIALLFFVPHWLTPHKELRFLLPLLPVLCALAGVGMQRILNLKSRALRWAAPLLALASCAYSAATFRQLTFGKLGLYERAPGTRSAFDQGGRENRLLMLAHDAPDLCGLKILTNDLDYLGGFSYLHRRVPLYGPAGPPPGSRHFNYEIAARGAVSGHALASDSNLVLVRIFDGSCSSDPAYSWHLN